MTRPAPFQAEIAELRRKNREAAKYAQLDSACAMLLAQLPEHIQAAGKKVLGQVPGDEVIDLAVGVMGEQFTPRSPPRGANLADRLRMRVAELVGIRAITSPIVADGDPAGERMIALQTEQKRILETDPAWKDVFDEVVRLGHERHHLAHDFEPLQAAEARIGPLLISLDIFRAELAPLLETARASDDEISAYVALKAGVGFLEGLQSLADFAKSVSMLPGPIPSGFVVPDSLDGADRAKMLAEASRVLSSLHLFAVQLRIVEAGYKPRLEDVRARLERVQNELYAVMG